MGKVEGSTGGTRHTQNGELYYLLVSSCGIEGFTQVGPRVSWLCSSQPQSVGTCGTAVSLHQQPQGPKLLSIPSPPNMHSPVPGLNISDSQPSLGLGTEPQFTNQGE